MATVENALPATHRPAEIPTLAPLFPTPASISTEDNEVEATPVTIAGTVQDVTEVWAGMRVQATGRPGTSGTLAGGGTPPYHKPSISPKDEFP